MQEEIKEILYMLKSVIDNPKETFCANATTCYLLLDYITNLQEESANKDYTIKEFMKANKRLKELCDKYEEEHKTTFEQWKKEIEQYQLELDKADSITQSCIFQGKKESEISFRNCINKMTDYKTRIDKAIDILESIYMIDNVSISNNAVEKIDKVINILKGDNNER